MDRRTDLHAVLIGVSDYDSEQIPDLTCPVNDALSMYHMLTDPQLANVPPNNIDLCLSGRPRLGTPTAARDFETAERELVSWLNAEFALHLPEDAARHLRANFGPTLQTLRRRLRTVARKGDTVLVYFSGHATLVDGELCLLPADVTCPADGSTGVEDIFSIKFNWIKQQLENSQASTKILMLDCCHAGSPLGLAEDDAFALLSSSASHQITFVPYDRNLSLFTHHLLQRLSAPSRGEATSVSLKDAFDFADVALREYSLSYPQMAQHPSMNQRGQLLGGDIILTGTRMIEPGPLERLITLAEDGNKEHELQVELDNLLQDEFLEESIYLEANELLKNGRVTSKTLLGGLGLLLFGRELERDNHQGAAKYLAGPCVQDFIYKRYGRRSAHSSFSAETASVTEPCNELGIDVGSSESDDSTLAIYNEYRMELLELGTTSYILGLYRPILIHDLPLDSHSVDNDINPVTILPDCVLKILKPRYWRNKTIRQKTRAYKTDYRVLDTKWTPAVHDSQELYIVMDYINGLRLRDYLAALRHPKYSQENLSKLSDSAVIGRARDITMALCDILGECEQLGIHHGDLSPDNIIVSETNDALEVWVIDFGVNYIVLERAATAPEVVPKLPHIDPDLLERREKATRNSDIYALGMLVMTMVVGHNIEAGQVETALDQIRTEYPGLGLLIESMLDRNSDRRVFEAKRSPEPFYSSLKTELGHHLRLYGKCKQLGTIRGWSALGTLTQIVFAPPKQLQAASDRFDRWSSGQVPRAGATIPSAADTKGPSRSDSLVASVTRSLAAVWVFLVKLLVPVPERFEWMRAEIDVLESQARVEEVSRAKRLLNYYRLVQIIHLGIAGLLGGATIWILVHGQYADLAIKGPGWFVGFSFSVLAVTYYGRLCATLTIPRSRLAELALRGVACLWAIPIPLGFIINPTWWPIWSAIGMLPSAVTNYCVARYQHQAVQRIMDPDRASGGLPRLPEVVDRSAGEFRVWWWCWLAYAAGLLMIGLLMQRGIIHDTWTYALLTVVVNAKTSMFEVGRYIARYRDCIIWFIYNDERAARYHAKSSAQTNEEQAEELVPVGAVG